MVELQGFMTITTRNKVNKKGLQHVISANP